MQPTDLGLKLTALFDSRGLQDVQHAMGAAGKAAAIKTATRDLGADRAFSGLRRRVALSSGYDIDGADVILHLRPKGLWVLADKGRGRQGTIRPRRPKKAVRTPRGLRRISHYSTSRGLHTIDDTIDEITRTAPVAGTKAMAEAIAKAGLS